MGRARTLLGALALWLVAAVLAAGGPALVSLQGVCETRCPSTAGRLAIGAIPVAAAAVPLYLAVVLLFRWRGTKDAGAPKLLVASLLTAYALAAGALAWWFADERVIHGNGPWSLFWALAFAGWLTLGLTLVTRAGRDR